VRLFFIRKLVAENEKLKLMIGEDNSEQKTNATHNTEDKNEWINTNQMSENTKLQDRIGCLEQKITNLEKSRLSCKGQKHKIKK